MELVIQDKRHLLTDRFNKWLLKRIKEKLFIDLDTSKLKVWDKYLEESDFSQLGQHQKLHSDKILILGINNLDYYASNGLITYRINPSVFIPGFNQLRVSRICKLINHGCLEVQGYPIFSNVFNEIAQNLGKYVDEYLNLGV